MQSWVPGCQTSASLETIQSSTKIAALQRLVAKYEKSRADFLALNEALQSLPASQRLDEVLKRTIAPWKAQRMLAVTRERLAREFRLHR